MWRMPINRALRWGRPVRRRHNRSGSRIRRPHGERPWRAPRPVRRAHAVREPLMHPTRPRQSLPVVGLAVLAMVLALAGCGRLNESASTVLREPVSSAGENPFTPAVGADQAGVTPPQGAGGSFPGDTVGLFGGT